LEKGSVQGAKMREKERNGGENHYQRGGAFGVSQSRGFIYLRIDLSGRGFWFVKKLRGVFSGHSCLLFF